MDHAGFPEMHEISYVKEYFIYEKLAQGVEFAENEVLPLRFSSVGAGQRLITHLTKAAFPLQIT
ncbi:hypothetical protein [Phyllobacterium sp. K27]